MPHNKNQPLEPLPSNVLERMKGENLKIGEGYYAKTQLGEIKKERARLRSLGFFVPSLPAEFETEAANLAQNTSYERPKSPGK